jgi:hypothetical protein
MYLLQNRIVTGLLTGCNILRRHLNKIGLTEVFCVGSTGQRKKSELTFCKCEALVTLTHHYPAWEKSGTVFKRQNSRDSEYCFREQKAC